MSCGGGHLGFPIGIKNINLVKDIPMILLYSLGSVSSLVSERKCSKAFFSEITNMIKAKLYMNVHWMVLYKLGFLFRYEIQNGGYGRT
jgi:hypothetical protein